MAKKRVYTPSAREEPSPVVRHHVLREILGGEVSQSTLVECTRIGFGLDVVDRLQAHLGVNQADVLNLLHTSSSTLSRRRLAFEQVAKRESARLKKLLKGDVLTRPNALELPPSNGYGAVIFTSSGGLMAAGNMPKTRALCATEPKPRLSPEESDRAYRLAVILAAAVELFEGDEKAARRWLNTPAKALGGATPVSYLDTEAGADAVRDLIGRLEHGIIS